MRKLDRERICVIVLDRRDKVVAVSTLGMLGAVSRARDDLNRASNAIAITARLKIIVRALSLSLSLSRVAHALSYFACR